MLTNNDANKLKCMQGIRMLATTSVIVGHTLVNFTLKPVKNPDYVEQVRMKLICN